MDSLWAAIWLPVGKVPVLFAAASKMTSTSGASKPARATSKPSADKSCSSTARIARSQPAFSANRFGQDKSPLLRPTEVADLDCRDLGESQLFGGLNPSVAGDNLAGLVC